MRAVLAVPDVLVGLVCGVGWLQVVWALWCCELVGVELFLSGVHAFLLDLSATSATLICLASKPSTESGTHGPLIFRYCRRERS